MCVFFTPVADLYAYDICKNTPAHTPLKLLVLQLLQEEVAALARGDDQGSDIDHGDRDHRRNRSRVSYPVCCMCMYACVCMSVLCACR